MLGAILNKSWRQHPTRHQRYGHLPPITKTTQVRRTRHAGYCWRSKDELISDVLLWTPTYGQAKAGRPARTYIQQLCEDTGCNPEDLPEAINNMEKWWERVRDICADDRHDDDIYIYIYIYVCVCMCVSSGVMVMKLFYTMVWLLDLIQSLIFNNKELWLPKLFLRSLKNLIHAVLISFILDTSSI